MIKKLEKIIMISIIIPSIVMTSLENKIINKKTLLNENKEIIVKKLIKVNNSEKFIDSIVNGAKIQIKQLAPEIISNIIHKNKELNDIQKKNIISQIQKKILNILEIANKTFSTKQFYEDASQFQYKIYMKYYTTEEIQDLILFYESSAGKKFLKIQDQINIDIINSLMQKYMPLTISLICKETEKFIKLIK